MEQGTVVAIVALSGSFLTVAVTAAVSIWSKKIDATQKIKEHQLSIRSLYVSKKIECGQVFVGKDNLRIIHIISLSTYYEDWSRNGEPNSKLASVVSDV